MLPAVLAALLLLGGTQDAPVDAALAAASQLAQSGHLAEARAAIAALLAQTTQAGRDRAKLLMALAALDNRLGDYDAARRHADDAAAASTALGDRQRAGEARNLAGLAYNFKGDYAAAAAAFSAALVDSTAAGDAAGKAEQLSNLGSVSYVLGRYEAATRTYAEAMQLAAAHSAEPWAARRTRILQANQAALDERLGRYEAALNAYRAIGEMTDATRPEEQAQILVNQGALLRRLGDPYKALASYDAARAIFAEHSQVNGEIGTLTNRGIALALDLGRPAEAIDAFSQALDLAARTGNRREALLAQLYRGETALRAGRLAQATADFEASRALADTLDAAEERWKSWYGLGRTASAAGDSTAAVTRLDRAIDVVETLRERLTLPSRRADFFQNKRDVYDARLALSLGAEPVDRTFALLERSRARAWRDQLGLQGEVSLAAVQQVLPADTVLLSYWYSAVGAAVIGVTRDSASATAISIAPDVLARLSGALERREDDWTRAADEVGAAIIPPAALRGMRRLIVVPDGPLGLVPFDVLPADGEAIVGRLSVRSLPTAAALLTPAGPRATWRAPWTTSLAAFGDPLPGADPWTSTAGASRLPASGREVRDVAALLGGQHRLFVGPDNLKARLADALAARPRVVHVATHAVADPTSAERSRLLFSPPSPGQASEALFLREMYDLPLAAVELVVLSACETERGQVVRGEGVQGFSRAILAAGARSAVTTLWRVPDQATATFMHAFYDRLQRGDDRAEALASAKRTLRADSRLSHPHYWAAFVLTGDDGPLPRAPRWPTVAGGLLVAAALSLAAVAGHRRWRSLPPAAA